MVATDDQYRASHCRKLAQESGEERHGFCRRVTAIINITGYQDDLRLFFCRNLCDLIQNKLLILQQRYIY